MKQVKYSGLANTKTGLAITGGGLSIVGNSVVNGGVTVAGGIVFTSGSLSVVSSAAPATMLDVSASPTFSDVLIDAHGKSGADRSIISLTEGGNLLFQVSLYVRMVCYAIV